MDADVCVRQLGGASEWSFTWWLGSAPCPVALFSWAIPSVIFLDSGLDVVFVGGGAPGTKQNGGQVCLTHKQQTQIRDFKAAGSRSC